MSSFPSYTPVTLRTHDDGRGEKLRENLCDSTFIEYTVETLRLLKQGEPVGIGKSLWPADIFLYDSLFCFTLAPLW